MSTEFASTLESDWETYDENTRFVRYCGNPQHGNNTPTSRLCYEFGTMTNFEQCKALADMGTNWYGVGEPLFEEPGLPKPGTTKWFDEILAQGRATFGTFPITVAVGSGTKARFTMENPT